MQAYEYLSDGDDHEKRADVHHTAATGILQHAHGGGGRGGHSAAAAGLAGRSRDERGGPKRRYDGAEADGAWRMTGGPAHGGPAKHVAAASAGGVRGAAAPGWRAAHDTGGRGTGGRDAAARPQSAGFRLHAAAGKGQRPAAQALHPALRPQSAPAVRKDLLVAQPRRAAGRDGWDGGRSGGPVRPGDSGQCRLQSMATGRGRHERFVGEGGGTGWAREAVDSDDGEEYEEVIEDDSLAPEDGDLHEPVRRGRCYCRCLLAPRAPLIQCKAVV